MPKNHTSENSIQNHSVQFAYKRNIFSRIVIVSSIGHMFARGGIRFDDLMIENDYITYKAYAHSKLANILHCKQLAKRLEDTGISVYSLHPGTIYTELLIDLFIGRRIPLWLRDVFKKMLMFSIKTPFHGAQTTIYCCIEDKIEGESGHYYEGCTRTNPSRDAQNEESAKRLWEISKRLVGLREE